MSFFYAILLHNYSFILYIYAVFQTVYMEGLKVYLVDIDEETEGVEKISFVEDPAFESNFMLYSKNVHKYSVIDEGNRIVFGPIILANSPVLRNEPPHGWHYHKYTPKAIQRISEKYFKQKNTDKVNIHHLIDVDGVYMIQSLIKDTSKGINPAGYEYTQDGSWFGAFKVENDSVYNSVLDGTFNGFSMEINAKTIDSGERIPLNINFSKSNYMKKNLSTADKMRRRRSFKSLYQKTLGESPSFTQNYGSVWTESGELSFDGDLAVGKEAFLFTSGNDPVIAPDGNYTITDGDHSGEVVTVVDGIITEVTNSAGLETEMEEETTTPPTDSEAATLEAQAEGYIAGVTALQDAQEDHLEGLIEVVKELSEKVNESTSQYSKISAELSEIKKKLKMPVETPVSQHSNYTAPATPSTEIKGRAYANQRLSNGRQIFK